MSQATIERLYAAFARLDGPAMQACYAPYARFRDEVFTLNGQREIGGMWCMLTDATKKRDDARAHWKLTTHDVTARSAHWDAHYLFSATGRAVVNHVQASFEFDDNGLIVQHRDLFSFWRWAQQALGTPGLLLGWTPFLRHKVRAQAAANLQRHLAKS